MEGLKQQRRQQQLAILHAVQPDVRLLHPLQLRHLLATAATVRWIRCASEADSGTSAMLRSASARPTLKGLANAAAPTDRKKSRCFDVSVFMYMKCIACSQRMHNDAVENAAQFA